MVVEYRPLQLSDKDQLIGLHEDWFPIRYKPAFYTFAVQGKVYDSDVPLFTQVAFDPSVNFVPGNVGGLSDQRPQSSSTGLKFDLGPPALADPVTAPPTMAALQVSEHVGITSNLSSCENSSPTLTALGIPAGRSSDSSPPNFSNSPQQSEPFENNSNGILLGAVTAQFHAGDTIEYGERMLDWYFPFTHGLYILTLGCAASARRRGIATELLQRVLRHARAHPRCGVVYLHVITYNVAAHRFYEKNGFVRVCLMEDYYYINGERYSAYLYACYVNGATPPRTGGLFNAITSPLWALASVISSSLFTLGTWITAGVGGTSSLPPPTTPAAGSSGGSGGGGGSVNFDGEEEGGAYTSSSVGAAVAGSSGGGGDDGYCSSYHGSGEDDPEEEGDTLV